MKYNRGWFSFIFHIIVQPVQQSSHSTSPHAWMKSPLILPWNWALLYMAAQAARTLRAPRNSIILQGKVGWTCIIPLKLNREDFLLSVGDWTDSHYILLLCETKKCNILLISYAQLVIISLKEYTVKGPGLWIYYQSKMLFRWRYLAKWQPSHCGKAKLLHEKIHILHDIYGMWANLYEYTSYFVYWNVQLKTGSLWSRIP